MCYLIVVFIVLTILLSTHCISIPPVDLSLRYLILRLLSTCVGTAIGCGGLGLTVGHRACSGSACRIGVGG